MENKKNKVVFGAVLLLIVLFLISYTYLVVIEEENDPTPITEPTLPEWQETGTEYSSKLEALDALKEERQNTPPSAYPEHMIDDKGFFNPDYMEYEKQRLIDSIYDKESFKRPEPLNSLTNSTKQISNSNQNIKRSAKDEGGPITSKKSIQELGLEHQLFFATNPSYANPGSQFHVKIMGNQTLKKDQRVALKLEKAGGLGSLYFPKNTPIWGTVSFKANRVLISIAKIGKHSTDLEGYDIQDGRLGIYVKNSFRSEATTEVLDDVVQDINIAGVPQVRGLRSIFQRNNRNVKVTLLDGHKFLLKPINQNL